MKYEDRQKIWDDYIASGGQNHPIVRHMFIDYSRYYEISLITGWFMENRITMDFKILDYGCGVGDYGISLIRQGIKDVYFYDFPRSTDFVSYRLQQEQLKGHVVNADINTIDLNNFDLIIFGEVLEHLKDPYLTLMEASQAKYIFTSSYPYRSDDPEDPYWSNHDHSDTARKLMPKCRELLENAYNYKKFDGELRLWVRK